MTTPMRGPALDPATLKIYPEFMPIGPGGVQAYGEGAAVNASAILEEAQANAVDAMTNYVAGYGNVAPGTRLPVKCVGGVLLDRPSDRTDISFDVFMDPSWLPPGGEPDFAAGGYLNMDSWVKTDWVS